MSSSVTFEVAAPEHLKSSIQEAAYPEWVQLREMETACSVPSIGAELSCKGMKKIKNVYFAVGSVRITALISKHSRNRRPSTTVRSRTVYMCVYGTVTDRIYIDIYIYIYIYIHACIYHIETGMYTHSKNIHKFKLIHSVKVEIT